MLVAFLLLAIAGCTRGSDELVVYSSRSNSLVQPLLEQYAEQTGTNIRVRYASTASVVATLLEEGDNSPADVIYLAEPSGWGVLSESRVLSQLTDGLLDRVDPRFRSSLGEWVGTSGRSKVVVYNTENVIPERDLPQSIMEFTDPKWKGRIGWAPTHGEWQISLMAISLVEGEDTARAWLEGIKDNDPKIYPNLISIVQAVANGEVDVGFVNHYYLHRFIEEHGESFAARNYYTRAADPGSLILVAGVGVLEQSDNKDAAEQFIYFLLGPTGQQYFASQTHEFPLNELAKPNGLLPALEEITRPDIDIGDLNDIAGTQILLREVGALP